MLTLRLGQWGWHRTCQKMGAAQAHIREVASLEKQIAGQERYASDWACTGWCQRASSPVQDAVVHARGWRGRRLAEVKAAYDKLVEEVARYQAAINKTMKYNKRVVDETAKLYERETEEVRPGLQARPCAAYWAL